MLRLTGAPLLPLAGEGWGEGLLLFSSGFFRPLERLDELIVPHHSQLIKKKKQKKTLIPTFSRKRGKG